MYRVNKHTCVSAQLASARGLFQKFPFSIRWFARAMPTPVEGGKEGLLPEAAGSLAQAGPA